MTVESPSKPKRGLPDQRAAWQGYAALLIALGVCIFLLIGADAVAHFPDERGTPIFYPLLLLKQSPYASTFWGGAIAVLMGLVVFAILRRVRAASMLMFIVAWGIVGYTMLNISGDQTDFKLYQSISHVDYVYRLFYTRDTTASEQTIHAYTIVKCDSLGLMCHYFSTPHHINTRLDGKSAFDESGVLFIDEAYNTLTLRVGADVYSIDPWADRPW